MPDLEVGHWLLLGAFGLIFLAAVAGAISKLFGIITKIAAPHFAHAVSEVLQPELETINRELQFNGGSSIKDAVVSTNRTVHEIAEQMVEFKEYQRGRNHDIINALAATNGFIRLAHPEFNVEWDGGERREQ